MIARNRWVKFLRLGAVAVGVCFIRWRAERLLADVRAIQMGKSTLTDAQHLMHTWGAWGEWQGDCDNDWCEFHVWLDDLSNALGRFPVLDDGQWESRLRWPRWMNRPYRWAGGRFAEVEADFEVRHGIIWSKSFAVLITPLPEKYDTHGELTPISESSVVGRARSSSNCFHRGYGASNAIFSAANPEVCLDFDGQWALSQFTPFADENTIRELMDFNLACITSWRGCRTAAQLMPTAASMFESSRRRANAVGSQGALETLPIWIVARDSEYIAVGEASTAPGISL